MTTFILLISLDVTRKSERESAYLEHRLPANARIAMRSLRFDAPSAESTSARRTRRNDRELGGVRGGKVEIRGTCVTGYAMRLFLRSDFGNPAVGRTIFSRGRLAFADSPSAMQVRHETGVYSASTRFDRSVPRDELPSRRAGGWRGWRDPASRAQARASPSLRPPRDAGSDRVTGRFSERSLAQ